MKTTSPFILKTLALAALVPFFAVGCAPKETHPTGAMPKMGVPAAHPLVQKISDWDEYTGRFQAMERVEVRSRVGGYVQSINFKDGQTVKKGDVLLMIDKRPFEIAYKAAEAEHAQSQAEYDQAVSDFNRSKSLRESHAVSEEEFEQRQQKMLSAEARRKAALAAIDQAILNLQFAEVTAPIDGRVSRNYVDAGNLVSGGSADATLLTTIVSLDPIYFYFETSESELLKYTRMNQAGTREESRTKANPIFVQLMDEKDFPHKGAMDFLDNEIAQDTGTIQGRAIFDNADHTIQPGMFGRARLLGSGEYEAVMVPDAIIGSDQTRKFVYVVDAQGKVAMRPVELGPLYQKTYRVIRQGLTAADVVVTGNIQKVRDGSEVNPLIAELPAPDAAQGHA